ncbi:hypothetical protein [Spiroplasma mirum]|nr:hypothetical protein [Spiroplasma atrichopogonis]
MGEWIAAVNMKDVETTNIWQGSVNHSPFEIVNKMAGVINMI